MARSDAATVQEYLSELDPVRRAAISSVRDTVLANLPVGYSEEMSFGMIAYVIPLEQFPDTYNGQPLMFAALASQKRHMSLYLMNVYAGGELQEWFVTSYRATGKRLDMGKACVRFKTLDELPLELVGEAIARTSVGEFLEIYSRARAK